MPAQVGTAYIDIRPDLTGFQRGVSRGINPTIDQTGKHIRSGLGGAFKAVALTAGGLFAGMQVFGFLKGSIDEARDAARVGRETAAVLKSTGGAAGVSAKQIEKWAKAVGRTVGVDNDLIQDAENLLLTFTSIGKDTFPDATQAAVDMAAALNDGQVTAEGLQGATIQVGKALQDPIKGITALRRVGVNFNQQQTDQIKLMVESGHTAEAQRFILAELSKEFGGLAAASADPFSRFRVAIDEVKEKVGNVLLPVLGGVATAFGSLLDVWDVAGFNGVLAVLKNWVQRTLIPWLGDNIPRAINWILGAGAAIGRAGLRALQGLQQWFDKTLRPWLQEQVPKLGEYLKGGLNVLGDWLDTTVKPWIDQSLKPWLQENVPKLTDFLKASAAGFQDLMNSLLAGINQWLDQGGSERIGNTIGKALGDALRNPRVVGAFLAGWGYLILQVTLWFPRVAIIFVRAAAGMIAGFVEGLDNSLDSIGNWFLRLGLKLIIWTATYPLQLFRLAYRMIFGGSPGFLPGLEAAIPAVLDWFTRLPGRLIRAMGDVARRFFDTARSWGGKLWDGFKDGVAAAFKGAAKILGDIILGGLGPLGDLIRIAGEHLGDGWGVEARNGVGRAGGGHGRIGGPSPSGSTTAAILQYAARTPVEEHASSTFRRGAITRSGHQSYHALGRAVDFVGPNLRAIFDSFLPVASQLKELIYSGAPFNIKNGQRVGRYAIGDHWDHVHVALDKGGITTRDIRAQLHANEAVVPLGGNGGGIQVAVYVGNQQITDIVDVQINGVSKEAERMLLGGLA